MLKKLLVAAIATAATMHVVGYVSNSGLAIGENVPAYDPHHVTGPDAGTDTCPVCKYGSRPAVQVWINGDDDKNVRAIADVVNKAAVDHKNKEFKGFIVYVTDKSKSEALVQKLETLAKEAKYKDIALTWIPKDHEGVASYKMNLDSDVKNTIIVYKDRKVTSKFVNLAAEDSKLKELSAAIEQVVTSPQ